jgi:hypothetical protein
MAVIIRGQVRFKITIKVRIKLTKKKGESKKGEATEQLHGRKDRN